MNKKTLIFIVAFVLSGGIYANNFVDSTMYVLDNVLQIMKFDNGNLWHNKLCEKIMVINTNNGSLISTFDIKGIKLKKTRSLFYWQKK
jgi:hypothetical protein